MPSDTPDISHIQKPKFPDEVTPESIREYKCQMRQYDLERLAAGVDPWQIQKENSIVSWPPKGPIKISHFAY